MRRWREHGLAVAAGFVLPLVLAVAWIPVRARLPNTDLALILVLAGLVIGLTGRRWPVVAAALSASWWFEFFDTRPFESWSIDRRPDLETTVVLGVVALITGELAVSAMRYRSQARSGASRFSSISGTASLLASGEDLVLVIGRVANELAGLLGLVSCTFEDVPADRSRFEIGRDGILVRRGERTTGSPGWNESPVELPVWGHRQVLGRFILEFPREAPEPRHEDALLAVALSDQVGAAFMTQAPPPPDPGDEPSAMLRVVE